MSLNLVLRFQWHPFSYTLWPTLYNSAPKKIRYSEVLENIKYRIESKPKEDPACAASFWLFSMPGKYFSMIQLSRCYSNSSKQPLTYESLNKSDKHIAHQSVLDRFISLFHSWSSILDFHTWNQQTFFFFIFLRKTEWNGGT